MKHLLEKTETSTLKRKSILQTIHRLPGVISNRFQQKNTAHAHELLGMGRALEMEMQIHSIKSSSELSNKIDNQRYYQ